MTQNVTVEKLRNDRRFMVYSGTAETIADASATPFHL